MDWRQGLKIIIGLLFYLAFFMSFAWIASERILYRLADRTAESLESSARKRMRENRLNLRLSSKQTGIFHRMEQRLVYSGLCVRFRWLTPEIWILIQLVVSGVGYFGILLLTGSWIAGMACLLFLQLLRNLAEEFLMGRNYRLVNENLLKFLDFLGNYSITAGEVTGVLGQISKYMEEPLKSVLDTCCYEAQMTGDTGLALLSMAEKIEHPQFKELVRNLEFSLRYSADFTVFVSNSRRAVREYMRSRQERRSMVKEAMVNMLVLLGMSLVILVAVEKLTGASIPEIMLYSIPGRISLGIMAGIFILFLLQIRKLDR